MLHRKQNAVLYYSRGGTGIYPGGRCLFWGDYPERNTVGKALVRTMKPSGHAEGKINCSAGEIHRNLEFAEQSLEKRKKEKKKCMLGLREHREIFQTWDG